MSQEQSIGVHVENKTADDNTQMQLDSNVPSNDETSNNDAKKRSREQFEETNNNNGNGKNPIVVDEQTNQHKDNDNNKNNDNESSHTTQSSKRRKLNHEQTEILSNNSNDNNKETKVENMGELKNTNANENINKLNTEHKNEETISSNNTYNLRRRSKPPTTSPSQSMKPNENENENEKDNGNNSNDNNNQTQTKEFDQEYIPEKIIGYLMANNNIEFRVKWQGYEGDESETLEPVSNLIYNEKFQQYCHNAQYALLKQTIDHIIFNNIDLNQINEQQNSSNNNNKENNNNIQNKTKNAFDYETNIPLIYEILRKDKELIQNTLLAKTKKGDVYDKIALKRLFRFARK